MPLCILCGSEATETPVDAGQHVSCPECKQYILAEGLTDLAKRNDWPQLRSDLARAVPWWFFQKAEPITLTDVTFEYLVASLKVFEEDPEKHEREAVEALVSEMFEGERDESLIAKVSQVLGRSPKKSREFVEDLIAGGVVEIVIYPTRQLDEGGKSVMLRGPLKKYERCKKSA